MAHQVDDPRGRHGGDHSRKCALAGGGLPPTLWTLARQGEDVEAQSVQSRQQRAQAVRPKGMSMHHPRDGVLDFGSGSLHPAPDVGPEVRRGKGIVDHGDADDAEHDDGDPGDADGEHVLRRIDLNDRDDRDGVARQHGTVGARTIVAARDVDRARRSTRRRRARGGRASARKSPVMTTEATKPIRRGRDAEHGLLQSLPRVWVGPGLPR